MSAPLTVAQLIAALTALPQDMQVVVLDSDNEDVGLVHGVTGGPDDVELPNAVYLFVC